MDNFAPLTNTNLIQSGVDENLIIHRKRATTPISLKLLSNLNRLTPTPVFDSFWNFAAERQNIFYKRIDGSPAPWTTDSILANYKFTNVYRAADRTSQYLIKNVIYYGDQSAIDLFFRILLFKLFNKIETWEFLKLRVGEISAQLFRVENYSTALSRLMANGSSIYSGAYIMPMTGVNSRKGVKHLSHLEMLQSMIIDRVPERVVEMRKLQQVFDLLRSYKGVGNFLAFQYAIDLNYSILTEFDEDEYIIAGPGAIDGIMKCFSSTRGLAASDIIRWVADRQEMEFERRGITFNSLWGRRMTLIDIQNVFCEISKYSRVAFPAITGVNGRRRIKQKFKPRTAPVNCWFPPKWGLNHMIQGKRDDNRLFR